MARLDSYHYQSTAQSALTLAWGTTRQRVIYMTPPVETLPRGDSEVEDPTVMGRWRAYQQRLETLGAEVRVVPRAVFSDGSRSDDLYREVYTRDRAFIIGNIAFLPDVSEAVLRRYGVRSAEIATFQANDRAFRARLQQDGFNVITTTGHMFEGGNLIYDRNSNTLFIGMAHGFAITPEANDSRDQLQAQYIQRNSELASFFQRQGINVEFIPLSTDRATQARFYHLDTGMMVLPNGELMIYPGAITPNAFERLQRAFEGRTIIVLTEEEARGFPTNMVSVGNTLVPTRISLGLMARLEGLGYRVMDPDQVGPSLGDGFFADGGVHCITNSVHLPTMTLGEGAALGRVGPLSERQELDGTILTTVLRPPTVTGTSSFPMP